MPAGRKKRAQTSRIPPDPGPELPSLRGRTVVITRARSQSEPTTSLLERLGAAVVHCPMIEIRDPADWSSLDAAIKQLDNYDWLVFTSVNGLDFFVRRCAEKGVIWPEEARHLLTCAIGPSTARALQRSGRTPDLVAGDSRGEGVLDAIVEKAGGQDRVAGLRFLIPRAQVAREFLPRNLGKLGARVDAVAAYQTVAPQVDPETITSLFGNGGADAILFTSSSTVSNFAAILGLDDLSTLLTGVAVGCIGPVTAETAAKYGLDRIIQPESFTATALVDCLARALGPK